MSNAQTVGLPKKWTPKQLALSSPHDFLFSPQFRAVPAGRKIPRLGSAQVKQNEQSTGVSSLSERHLMTIDGGSPYRKSRKRKHCTPSLLARTLLHSLSIQATILPAGKGMGNMILTNGALVLDRILLTARHGSSLI